MNAKLATTVEEPKRILLADDEAGIRKVLGIYLADAGYDVLTAENGEDALRVFRRERPPIVLTDIKMPGMDGIDLLQQIKSEDPDTEVIMISGHGDMDLAIKSLKLEATDFITKPINDDTLEIALKRARERIMMRAQLKAYTENLEALVREKSARLIEVERMVAVGQAIEGLSSAISSLAGDLKYFNEMPCFVSIHDPNLTVIAANDGYKERLGDKVGRPSWEIYSRSDPQGESCPVARTFASGEGYRSKETIVYSDGRTYPAIVHTAPIRNRDGNVSLVLEICADVSEIQRLQQELATTQRRYQQLFDAVPCYVSVLDRELKLTAVNDRFKQEFGDKIGRFCYDVYKDESAPCSDCLVRKTFADGQSHQAEMTVAAKTGDQVNVLCWTSPIRDTAGNITRVIEMCTDITEIRRLQDNLTSLGLMMGSLSHSIKGVLTGLDAGLYFLESGVKHQQAEKIDEGMDVVKLMVERIRNVVLNVLYYAKERQLRSETVDVLTFSEDICRVVKTKLNGRDIDFVSNLVPPLGSFEIDATILRSALQNLFENAIDACTEDKTTKAHRIEFDVRATAEEVVFEIADNGIGMSPETQAKAFSLFFSQKGHAGTGLGLFITQKIVAQHGGNLALSSDLGQGTRFIIRIPRRQAVPTGPEHFTDPISGATH